MHRMERERRDGGRQVKEKRRREQSQHELNGLVLFQGLKAGMVQRIRKDLPPKQTKSRPRCSRQVWKGIQSSNQEFSGQIYRCAYAKRHDLKTLCIVMIVRRTIWKASFSFRDLPCKTRRISSEPPIIAVPRMTTLLSSLNWNWEPSPLKKSQG